ncbi:DUF7919 family protein [Crossiella sp. CA198]|uniref:DUF7919 family protein n=1 Tax=Crossiella sp. CA198 TaxID=3455607 RepID=UPI003F8D0764
MAVYEDLSRYGYQPVEVVGAEVLTVGWLGAGVEFERGEPAADFVDALRKLAAFESVGQTRGYHYCWLCQAVAGFDWEPAEIPCAEAERGALTLGSAEIHVPGAGGVVYAAPNLICHYVLAHQYSPPAEFVAAVLAASARGGVEWGRVKAALPVGAVVRGVSDSTNWLGLLVELDGFPGVDAGVAFRELGVGSVDELEFEFGVVREFVVLDHVDVRRQVVLRLAPVSR